MQILCGFLFDLYCKILNKTVCGEVPIAQCP